MIRRIPIPDVDDAHTEAAEAVAAAVRRLADLHRIAEALPAMQAEAEAEYRAAIARLGFSLPGAADQAAGDDGTPGRSPAEPSPAPPRGVGEAGTPAPGAAATAAPEPDEHPDEPDAPARQDPPPTPSGAAPAAREPQERPAGEAPSAGAGPAPATTNGSARSAATSAGRPGGRPLAARTLSMLEVLERAGHAGATSEDISAVTGHARGDIATKLSALALADAPRVRRLGARNGSPVWVLTGPVPELEERRGAKPVQSAALQAAGVEG